MNKKILIIFFASILLTILIYYNSNDKKTSILLLGDNYLENLNNYNYIYFLQETNINKLFKMNYKTYKQINEDINNNYKIYNKNKVVSLNEEISKADIIIISANNDEYLTKCSKNNRVFKEYNYKLYNEINSLINKINKISHSKIIIIGNYCSNKNGTKTFLDNLYNNYNYINMYEIFEKYNFNNINYYLCDKINEIIK